MLGSHLRFDRHASAVAKICGYRLCALQRVRSVLSDNAADQINCNIVEAELDCCISTVWYCRFNDVE
jgi:hypothetical protein